MGAASTKEALGGKGKAVPSPEDVEADVALEVNVGMINHCLTLHLGGVMWVTLSHLAPEKEKCRVFWAMHHHHQLLLLHRAASVHSGLTLKLNTNFPLL